MRTFIVYNIKLLLTKEGFICLIKEDVPSEFDLFYIIRDYRSSIFTIIVQKSSMTAKHTQIYIIYIHKRCCKIT